MEKSYYSELYKRNWPIIPLNLQQKMRKLNVAVAGCGSTGGAFIDGLLRLGIESYHLADNGSYELNNLNRQMVSITDLNHNKAMTHTNRILSVNPEARIKVWRSGISEQNLNAFLDGVDFLFDAVDVTTRQGMEMKLALHRRAFEKKIPTGSALDLGYTQWLQSYNYHQGEALLKGNYNAAIECQNPLKALIMGFSPVEDLPLEITVELLRLLRSPNESACQLACVCFALSGMATPYMLHFVSKGYLPQLKTIDLVGLYESESEKIERQTQTLTAREELNNELNKIL